MFNDSYMNSGLFITDFDRTLLKNDKTIGLQDIKSLECLGDKGIFRAIATGRSLYSFKKIMKKLGFSLSDQSFPIDYLIFSTGAGVMNYKNKKIIKKTALKSDETAHIVNYFEKYKLDYMIHSPIPYTENFVFKFHGYPNPDFFARINLYREFCSPLEDEISRGNNNLGNATEVMAIIPRHKANGIDEKIKKDLSDFSVIRATSPLDHESLWIEVFPLSVSKSQSGLWLANRLGIRRENIVSIGNDYNDMDLLQCSGRGFVVDNAPDELKLMFEIVSSNNMSGVSQAIYRAFT